MRLAKGLTDGLTVDLTPEPSPTLVPQCATAEQRRFPVDIGPYSPRQQTLDMTTRELEEYRALRATIRERGSLRVAVFAAGMIAWAAITVATAALASTPLAVLLPLLILAATFEAVFALHVGVERVGRYLAVFYDDQWERVAMGFGRPAGGARSDALFAVPFFLAALFNFGPVIVLHPIGAELVFVGGAHVLFALRLLAGRLAASKQRAIDRDRFLQLKEELTTSVPKRS